MGEVGGGGKRRRGHSRSGAGVIYLDKTDVDVDGKLFGAIADRKQTKREPSPSIPSLPPSISGYDPGEARCVHVARERRQLFLLGAKQRTVSVSGFRLFAAFRETKANNAVG